MFNAFVFRAAIMAGFLIWIDGSAGAGHVVQFVLWILALAMICGAINNPKGFKKRPVLWKVFCRLVDLVYIVLLVWLGCPVLATAWTVSCVMLALMRQDITA